MRYAVDLAVLGIVFFFALQLFESGVAAMLAGLILAGAADALIWDAKKR